MDIICLELKTILEVFFIYKSCFYRYRLPGAIQTICDEEMSRWKEEVMANAMLCHLLCPKFSIEHWWSREQCLLSERSFKLWLWPLRWKPGNGDFSICSPVISFPRNKNTIKGLCKLNYIDFFTSSWTKTLKISWTSGNMLA